ncbi:ATP-binding protein [Fusobacterium sp.]|uniref:HAMP domain-containing sensor histidine kinase n=1 Tax=Fusobacterium sp. TaxID=68766 RepID=UPI00396C48F9
MLSKIKQKTIDKMPISIKVTLWYTFFTGILLAIILTGVFFISDMILTNVSQKELMKSVNKIAMKPGKFESYDDGIFFIKYNSVGKRLGGVVPVGFSDSAKYSPDKVNIQKKNGNKFFYYDMKIKGQSGSWIRGIFPVTRVAVVLKNFLLVFVLSSPVIFFLIIYGGYKIIKNGFKPVERISDTVMKIKENKDFSKRIDIGAGKDEIHKMAESFNSLLNTLESSYLHEKQFSSDVSHELRTPISVILAESSYGMEYLETLEEARDSFSVINRQSKKMADLISQILELVKLEHEEQVSKTCFDISATMRKITRDFEKLSMDKNISLKSYVEDGIHMYGNEFLLERAVYNILTNAVKFTKNEIKLALTKDNESNNCIIEISDNGIGIPQEEQDKIWNRFYQVEQSRNKVKNEGYGLGLSIVSNVVRLHKGKIKVRSTPEKETTFEIILPFERETVGEIID